MQEQNFKLKKSYAAVKAAAATVIFTTLITVLGDLYLPLKDWLKAVFTHHWIGKGVLAVVLWVLFFAVLSSAKNDLAEDKLPEALNRLSVAAVFGTLVLFAFFVYEAFWK